MSFVSAPTFRQVAPAFHETRLALRAGVSLLAIALAAPAMAADRPVPTVSRGANGADGSAGFFGIKSRDATAGLAGEAVNLADVDVAAAQKSPTTTVEIGSAGGNGGWGAVSGWASVPGADAGSAANVTVSLNDGLGGRGDQKSAAPRLWVYSRGGKGGGSLKDVGAGGSAGSVGLTLSSTVSTEGAAFLGLRVSSIGGAAGYGGTDASIAGAKKGGASGDVSLEILASGGVSTTGRGATAVIVESLGGAGSERGMGTFYSNPFVTEGGASGTASLKNGGHIETQGDYAIGALVQSVGGTGGEQQTTGGGQPGAKGGAADTVVATGDGSILTSGQYAFGLLAQSVGGKGGKGGGASFSGGDGGDAGNGAAVTVTNHGSVETRGLGAIGVIAQSVGGGKPLDALQVVPVKDRTGGGAGGFGGGVFFGSGGAGGQGGLGGTVEVVNDGSILTSGNKAPAILAQSIGGGGGGGGRAEAFGFFFDVALGGDGGIGGKGQDVTVTSKATRADGTAATITTKGDESSAILAQSVGGGGGIGGDGVSRAVGLIVTVATSNGGAGGKGNGAGTVKVENGAALATDGSRAYGVQAMSIGGGGGAGGTSVATAIGASVPKKVPINIIIASAQGGSGGEGATGGRVEVTNSGTVRTGGGDASGILAMSVGGGGGTGGLADTFSLAATDKEDLSISVNTALGGSGGTGGTAEMVKVTNSGAIKTTGAQAAGIAAYSIGGGGGVGGSADVMQRAVGKGYAMAINGVLGGTGGSGNKGGRVEITNTGAIEAQGYAANGIHAMSVGGGGGVGGSGTVKTITGIKADDLGIAGGGSETVVGLIPVKPKTMSINGVVGGSGGKGGDAGSVDVTNAGSIRTLESDARGIFAQSIGGGGGAAPIGMAEPSNKVQLSQVVGGKGGAAGDGGDVTVRNTGAVETIRDGAYAIQAQSVGGGGGSGGSASSTSGDSFTKELAKDTGKAIGTGMMLAWKSLDDIFRSLPVGAGSIMPEFLSKRDWKPEIPFSVSYNTALGGAGGGGGKGGNVTVTNSGNLTTIGNSASAIFAQSIGGGGGNAGNANVSGGKIINLKSATGGDGGVNGEGGKVEINNSGSIVTKGALSFGILTQSVGGGGGTATTGVDKSGWDPLTSISEFAGYQTVTGGQNGAKGRGGAVTVENSGSISTGGYEAHGILAQSIGGGGGITVLNVNDPNSLISLKGALTAAEKKVLFDASGIDVDKEISALDASQKAKDKTKDNDKKATIDARVGGDGATEDGGAVTVRGTGSITTGGVAAFGILAQSIGGGGGLSTNAQADLATAAGRIGGTGGAEGKGGQVSVSLDGSARIETAGIAAYGVFAQSIGGGGGYGGTTPSAPAFVSTGKATGNGGKVEVTLDREASVLTLGQKAHGVFAQSLGGGGGWVADLSDRADFTTTGASRDKASGTGGAIDVTVNGSITTQGLDASAIVVQSGVQRTDGSIDSAKAGGQIQIVVDGAVSGGSGSGAAIRLDGGLANTINVMGHGQVSALSGRAILGSFGQDTLTNRGLIVGDIDLRGVTSGAGDVFVNGAFGSSAGILRTGAHGIVDLGANGQMTNHGIVDIGGVGRIADLKVNGNFTQSSSGQLLIDIDPLASDSARRNDHLTVTGTADLGGKVQPNVVGSLLPGDYPFLTAHRIQSLTAGAPDTAIQSDSVPISWAVVQNKDSAFLRPTANFVSPLGMTLTSDQRGAATALQEMWNGGSRPQATLFADFLSVRSKAGYAAALDELNPESIQDVLHGRASEARAGLTRVNSCPAFTGTGTLLQEGDCVWGRVAAGRTAMFGTADDGGYRQSALSYQGGMQTEFARDWFFGLTGAYTRAYLRDADQVTGSITDAADVAVALKRQMGPWLFSASTNVGYGWSQNLRSIDIGNGRWLAHSKSEVLTAASRLRASYQFLFDNWYVRPYAEVDVLYTYSPGYAETGARALNLNVRDLHKTLFAFSPNVEIGGRYDISTESWIRPYGKFGVTMLSDDKFVGRASFQGSNGLGLFSTAARIPDFVGDVGLGMQVRFGNGIEMLGEYQSQIGDRFLSHTGSVRLQARF
ncbi:autotransporter outer membrane beta-barrel domain-containing protein [Methylobacterium aquaticum]|uniref:autotransporter outer membrane beta-barrel domain-containing protein n=1 Tax=Methylobacterium aquaticum TaxID=270351 RepID=UPI003D184384